MTVHLDISLLVANPRRTGIQRAERELIRHWPGPAPLIACRFDPVSGRMQALSDKVCEILCDDVPEGGVLAEAERLQRDMHPVDIAEPARLVNAELFGEEGRAAYYKARSPSCRSYWLVYDFLPWLHPEWFIVGSALRLMDYLEALRSVPDVAFISAQTRDDFARRIQRHAVDGPIIAMGADGLGLERQSFTPQRTTFVMLGTIEPRKNALSVMRAFQQLWSKGISANLTMIGAISLNAADELALLAELNGWAGFRHLDCVSDEDIRNAFRHARAVLFPSEGEGYGIPPVEALHAGIPVVISESLPALAGRKSWGQIRLAHVCAESIAAAVESLMDDVVCGALWEDASRMRLTTWSDFARKMADWVQE